MGEQAERLEGERERGRDSMSAAASAPVRATLSLNERFPELASRCTLRSSQTVGGDRAVEAREAPSLSTPPSLSFLAGADGDGDDGGGAAAAAAFAAPPCCGKLFLP